MRGDRVPPSVQGANTSTAVLEDGCGGTVVVLEVAIWVARLDERPRKKAPVATPASTTTAAPIERLR
jgi:hypothetical protein